MNQDFTTGSVTKSMLLFAGPMIAGNLLQQCYNIADTWIVGRYLGPDALGAVGAAFTLMTFLTSILIGLCMGSGSLCSFYYGKKDEQSMKNRMQMAFLLIGSITVVLNVLVLLLLKPILYLLQVPNKVLGMMQEYMQIIVMGMCFVFLYNYCSYLLRAIGNSVVPLFFLGVAVGLNIILDLVLVVKVQWGIGGAAAATVIAQAAAGLGIAVYTWFREKQLRFHKSGFRFEKRAIAEILRFSFASSIQQSVMNFGILMIQGLVNSFGPGVMAAFAAAVKIDSFAYMPAQEFGNAFSLFISQNYGAGNHDRVKQGTKSAMKVSIAFCLMISGLVFVLARYLMLLFVKPTELEIITTGMGYLRVEGAFYCGIGILFLLYGYYRGVNRPEMSLVLTIISLGTRVLLAYILAPVASIGVWGIWWAIPVGWCLADIVGIGYMVYYTRKLKGRYEGSDRLV
ncbi:MAG: MATE family efflux transporter [Lachnospiraceae bacterium]|nr:MATE family efflux transporter [Lachnospiraceae bacterium]